ncbi:T-cell-specific surface glycoprotein CD28-like [Mustelus asterias]
MERTGSLGIFILSLIAAIKLGESNVSIAQPQFVRANPNGEASLMCGSRRTETGEKLSVALYKGKKDKNTEVCTASFSNGMPVDSERKDLFRCQVLLSQTNVSITIRGLNVTDTDRYFCQLFKTQPAPFSESSEQWSIIYIDRASDCPAGDESSDGILLTVIFIGFTSLLFLYSVSVTVMYCKHKLKDDTIYINVRK